MKFLEDFYCGHGIDVEGEKMARENGRCVGIIPGNNQNTPDAIRVLAFNYFQKTYSYPSAFRSLPKKGGATDVGQWKALSSSIPS